MGKELRIGKYTIGEGHPVYIIAEIGINHNGDIEIAKKMIRAAKKAGVDAVKFQKRTPIRCVPPEEQKKMRETPWGYISYLEYRERVEFGEEEYNQIANLCSQLDIDWFASAWDEESVDFLEQFDPIAYKVPSASLTDNALIDKLNATRRPIILSTGMSTMEEIRKSVSHFDIDRLAITHATSTYPCPPEELNLRMIQTLTEEFDCPIGYSGHETGLVPSAVAVALGAKIIERHFTLDRAMWGTDQSGSVEPGGMQKLVKYIRVTEQALGDGVKKVYDSERPSWNKLRRVK